MRGPNIGSNEGAWILAMGDLKSAIGVLDIGVGTSQYFFKASISDSLYGWLISRLYFS